MKLSPAPSGYRGNDATFYSTSDLRLPPSFTPSHSASLPIQSTLTPPPCSPPSTPTARRRQVPNKLAKKTKERVKYVGRVGHHGPISKLKRRVMHPKHMGGQGLEAHY